MAIAFSTMSKYGINILTATQHMNINAYICGCRECRCDATLESMACEVRHLGGQAYRCWTRATR